MKEAYLGIDAHKEQNVIAIAFAGRGICCDSHWLMRPENGDSDRKQTQGTQMGAGNSPEGEFWRGNGKYSRKQEGEGLSAGFGGTWGRRGAWNLNHQWSIFNHQR